MPSKRVTRAAVIATAAVLVGVPLADIASRGFMQTQPKLIVDPAATNAKRRAIVYLTGVQNDADLQSRQLRPLWQQHGDVVTVQYPRKRFSARDVVRTVYRRLRDDGYEEFLVIAASFGARVGIDLVDYNAAQPDALHLAGMILADPPMTDDDLIPKGASLSRIWMPGALSNWGTMPFWMLFGDPIQDAEGSAEMDPQLIREADVQGLSWPLSGYGDQVRDIVRRKQLAAGSYRHVPAVILRADDDQIVRQEATGRWLAVLGEETPVLTVRSIHVAFLHFPRAWRQAFEQAFQLLPL